MRLRTAATAVFLALITAATIALSGPSSAQQPAASREVNLTSDSAPGWIPSEELEKVALKTVMDFLAAEDSGRYAAAYGMWSEGYRSLESLADYTERLLGFNTSAGAVIERRMGPITWTKDPADAPGPGVYVAIDLVSRYANIDRHCGYVVLWQAPVGGPFRVMREESTYLDNETAATIARQGAAADVEQAWARASASCPNYRGATSAGAAIPEAGPIPEAPGSTTGYSSVAAALAGLRSRSDVVISEKDGWIIATQDSTSTLWSFTPTRHPAYPAAVKRQMIEKDGQVFLQMNVQCEASKAACDDLVRAFRRLNAELTASLRGNN